MEIKISPEAVAQAIGRGGQIVIFLGTASGCCIGGVPTPMVELGPPRRTPENYEVREAGGLTVYLSREAAALAGEVEVTLSRGLWSKYLSVKWINEADQEAD